MRGLLIFGITCLAASWAKYIPENPEALRTTIYGLNAFSKEFYKRSVENIQDNYVVSPISASMVFSMASFGAGGNTKRQMRSGLRIPEDDPIAKSGIKSVTDLFKDSSSVEVKLATKIFTNTGLQIKPEFKEITEKAFGSAAQNVDFSKADEATQTINEWAAAQTENKIQDLLQADAVKDASMVLANAVYFKGKWAKPFDGSETVVKPFHVDENTAKDVSMMTTRDRFFYGELPSVDARFIELPYQQEESTSGKSFKMVVVVPNEITGLKKFEQKLPTLDVGMVRKSGRMTDIELQFPKFKVESTIDLKDIMVEMGMPDMFSDKADFTGITDSVPLRVSKALQKAVIDVNEEGSEAAAATSVIIAPMALPMPPLQPVQLTIDRPFYYAIVMVNKDVEGGIINSALFHGRVVHPTY